MNGRDADNRHQPDQFVRRLGYSYDGGETWTDFRNATDLPNPQCHGATKRYRHNGADVLLYTGPSTTFRQDEKPYGRWNMAMHISRDGGKSWSRPQVFYKPVSSYSDMTIFDDGTVGVIYERGAEGTVRYWDELAFARFKIDLSKF
jgi:sialidase-1